MPRKKSSVSRVVGARSAQQPSSSAASHRGRAKAKANSRAEEEEEEEEMEESEPSEEEPSSDSDSSASVASPSSSSSDSPSPPPAPSRKRKRKPAPQPRRKAKEQTSSDEEEESEEEEEEEEEAAPRSSKKQRARARKPASSSTRADESADSDSDAEASSSSGRNRPKASLSSSGDDSLDPDELADEWRCSAADALTFRLVRAAPERDNAACKEPPVESFNFHPTYTHQLWDDEEIVGYKKVKALVAFTSGALYTYLNVEYEEKCPDVQVPDIQALLGSKLRGGFTLDYEDFKSHIHDPFTPPGQLIAEYTLPTVDFSFKETVTYEVYRGGFDLRSMRDYHARLQFFLLFFIDRSSFINDSDPVWEVILLFQKRVCSLRGAPVTTYHIVGYTTLYKFLAYPSDWKMRLSQILILPPYQRAGHGQRLLQLVYQEAEARAMVELNIEDPSPVFQMIRDLTDITLCRKARFFEKLPGSDMDPLAAWDPAYASVVKASLRITMRQVRRCYEIFKLNSVNDRHKNSKPMTAYRLEVKARLFRQEAEVLSMYSQKPEERKEKLAEMYNELEQHYLAVIKKARLH